MKNLKIMQAVDESLFNQLEKIKEHPQYQKILDQYNLLEEYEQSIINTILMCITLFIPLSLILLSFLFYNAQKSELQMNEKIIESASQIISKTRQLDKKTNLIFGPQISNESALRNKMSALLSNSGIDTSKISISNFELYEAAGINEINARLQFKGFSSANMYNFLQRLFVRDKFKAKTINIEKKDETKLIDGSLEVIYYSKISN